MFLTDILYRICQILNQINEVIVKSIYLINAKILNNLIPVYFIKKLNLTSIRDQLNFYRFTLHN